MTLPAIPSRPMVPDEAAAAFQNVAALALSRVLPGECPRCGQQSAGVHVICDRCRAADRCAQGTQDRLFAPAPAGIPGQLQL